jgi:hypothetical protein
MADLDEGRFRELLVESDDLQSDAMGTAHRGLADYVAAAQEARHEARSELRDEQGRARAGVVGTGAVGLGIVGLSAVGLAWASSAFAADARADIMALQTAAGIENLAVATYKAALTLPFIGGSSANAVVKSFAIKTMAQHGDHAAAFNAAAVKLGGRAQTGPDPKYAPVVTAAVPTIKGAADVVGLAITLEDIAAQTYVKNVGLVSTAALRQLFASVAGVESQHRAILLAVQALLKAGTPKLIALPPNAPKLPADLGSVGSPTSFYPVRLAAPVSEGAVK